MKRSCLIWLVIATLVVLAGGCRGPAEDYVRAEASAWAVLDAHLDRWIDEDDDLQEIEKDALRALNTARKARVKHALEQFDD